MPQMNLLQRTVQPEWLDELAPAEPRAVRSRRDLARVNAWMGNAGLVARALGHAASSPPPRRVAELGAGDGTFLLRVARRLSARWSHVEAVLVDRTNLVTTATGDAFRRLGWTVRSDAADVFDWLETADRVPSDVMLCNLFLHQFRLEDLRRLLKSVAQQTELFLACEPRRSPLALTAARLLWLIGCNDVTRHDAVVSVQAGFLGREVSNLWPQTDSWELREERGGLFSHLFVARRTSPATHG